LCRLFGVTKQEYFKDIESLAHVALPNKENRRL